MNTVLIFPHQIRKELPFSSADTQVFLVEEFLFFRQYKFHKQKLVLHRASMKFYEHYLTNQGFDVKYIESQDPRNDVRVLIKWLKSEGVNELCYFDPTDNYLERRITETAQQEDVVLHKSPSALFLNTVEDLESYFKNSKRYFQTDFYIHQRKKRNILIDQNAKPLNGQWSFDADNRLKYPKEKKAPKVVFPVQNEFYKSACDYVATNFKYHFGIINPTFIYPSTFEEAEAWLDNFLVERFEEFGIYEDAIVAKEVILNHSLLTPMLNIGLLNPEQVIDKALDYAKSNNLSFNSLEGFIRQIVGWREFMRAIYEREGTRQRTTNYWKFDRKIPASFYDGTTGIIPIDETIQKILKTGYCHHIERLMILGNFMLLCEFDPDEVYRWFMELFIDSYDWVMVPNIYGMSQFADGGLMCTKPYISGSNYVFKMSDYAKNNDWAATWDALFWRFMHVHRDFFLKNPRLGMLVRTFDKMAEEKQEQLMTTAENYLERL